VARQSTVSCGLGRPLARARAPLLVIAVVAVVTTGASISGGCR
jgi:citrate lyase alpha subunit